MDLASVATSKGGNMRFLASFTIANAAESQRRLREIADRDRQVRQHPHR
jgi:hypothetical protein